MGTKTHTHTHTFDTHVPITESGDGTWTLLGLYEYEAQLRLHHYDELHAILDQMSTQPAVELKTLETMAGMCVCSVSVCVCACVCVCVYNGEMTWSKVTNAYCFLNVLQYSRWMYMGTGCYVVWYVYSNLILLLKINHH